MGKGPQGKGNNMSPNANTANEIEDFKKRQRNEKMTVRAIRLLAAGPPLLYEWPW